VKRDILGTFVVGKEAMVFEVVKGSEAVLRHVEG